MVRALMAALVAALLVLLAVIVPVPAASAQAGVSVVISEIFYNPDGQSEDDEFIELHNVGGDAVDLGGWRFSQGVDFVAPAGTTIAAGDYFVVAADVAAFAASFGVVPDGAFGGTLSNGGETLTLVDSFGVQVDSVSYDDRTPWPTSPDGDGDSLQILNPSSDNEVAANWGAGTPTPGSASQVNVDVIFSVQRGWYSGSQTVVLTSTVPGATIRYNTNGEGGLSRTYNGPISVSDNGEIQVIQAQASLGDASGPMDTHTYVFREDVGIPVVSMWYTRLTVAPGEDEQVVSFEFLPPPSTGLAAVQANAGTTTSQGGGAAGNSDKVFFRGAYGAGTLDGDLFGDFYYGEDPPATEFDQLSLRAQHQDPVFMKRSMAHDALLATNSLGLHSRWVLSYKLRDQFPDLRLLEERPEGGYMETYTGIDKHDWVAGHNDHLDGFPRPTSFAEAQQSYDIQQVLDASLVLWHSSTADVQTFQNIRVAGPVNNVGDGGDHVWRWFPWDMDQGYGFTDASYPLSWATPDNAGIYLLGVEEVRYLMSDRAACAFQPGGALHPDVFLDRLATRIDDVKRAQDGYFDFTYFDEMKQWMPARANRMISSLRNPNFTPQLSTATGKELYPPGDLLSISVNGTTVSISSPNPGAIYYRLDGGDPRTLTGGLDPAAIQYAGPFEVPVGETDIIARSFDATESYVFDAWSPACNDPMTITATAGNGNPVSELVITELHYNPPTIGLIDGDLREYVEIHNPTSQPVSLNGMSLTGVGHTFGASNVVEPGGYFVVASDFAQFVAAYGTEPDDTYGGRLDDSGETITLTAADGAVIDVVDYDDSAPWPTSPDAQGPSLSLVDVAADNNNPANWAPSNQPTPGQPNVTAIVGDANCDGTSDDDDARAVLEFLLDSRDPAACPHAEPGTHIDTGAADYNNDGTVEMIDAFLIARCAVDDHPSCNDS